MIQNNQEQFRTIKNNQEQSRTIENNQEQSRTIENNQEQFRKIKNNQEQSRTIQNNQGQSRTFFRLGNFLVIIVQVGKFLGPKHNGRQKKILQEDILLRKHNLFGNFFLQKTFDGHFRKPQQAKKARMHQAGQR